MQGKKYISVKAQPLISIVTLNWNQTDITCQFLESTRRLNYKNYEVLVCDIGSAVDPTAQILRGEYPNTRVLKTDAYARTGNDINWVVSQAKGDFILLINNNTEITENVLDDLLAPFLTDSFLGAACPKIRSYHQPKIIQYAGYRRMNMLTGKTSIIGKRKEDNGQFDQPAYTHGAYSGAMMLKKSMIEDNKDMLAQNFFIYFDDSEVSARILKKGYRILYQPKAVVYNKDSVVTDSKSAIKVYYDTRNRILFMRRNAGWVQLFVFLTVFVLVGIPANTVKFVAKRQFAHLQSFFKAIHWNFRRMRPAWK
ncbi:MAG: glycosyltransferase family 2 protein [Agriterribacter sp.]